MLHYPLSPTHLGVVYLEELVHNIDIIHVECEVEGLKHIGDTQSAWLQTLAQGNKCRSRMNLGRTYPYDTLWKL